MSSEPLSFFRPDQISSRRTTGASAWMLKLSYAVFWFAAVVSVLWAFSLRQGFQDSWLLAGIWPFLLILFGAYLSITIKEDRLDKIALVSALLAFLLFFLPGIKYVFNYGGSSDMAYHTAFTRDISMGHFQPETTYSATPGFHAIVASLSGISGTSVESWLKFFSPFLAFCVPLAVHFLCRIGRMPKLYTKIFSVLSVFSLSYLYSANGTSFSAPFIIMTICFYSLREVATSNKSAYSMPIILSLGALVFWHAGSSLIVPLVFISAGLISSLRLGRAAELQSTKRFLVLGILGIVAVFSYWMFDAGLVWSKFVLNIQTLSQADTAPSIIPARVFQLQFGQQVLVGLMNHARDLLFIFLGGTGTLHYLIKRISKKSVNVILEIQILLFCAFLCLVFAVFLGNFGNQGYKRYLIYLVAFATLPAGYGLEAIASLIVRKVRCLSMNVVLYTALGAIALVSAFQLYPYQPVIPAMSGSNASTDPIVWMHQPNTINQYFSTGFALDRLFYDDHPQILIDAGGRKVLGVFWNSDVTVRFRSVQVAKVGPGFLILHDPGSGGGYQEQVESRSEQVIQNIRDHPGMDIIYDNGRSFILYFPGDISELGIFK